MNVGECVRLYFFLLLFERKPSIEIDFSMRIVNDDDYAIAMPMLIVYYIVN